MLTRVWPLPDDLPHAAGLGDLLRVTRWFDEAGAPAPGDVAVMRGAGCAGVRSLPPPARADPVAALRAE